MLDERGQSEVLGFILVFAIIVTAIGFTYAFGLSGLEDTRNVERVNNAQRAFDVLADNVEDIVQRRSPSRATEVKLADARIQVGDPVTMNLSVPGKGFHQAADVQPIVFSTGEGSRLRYVSGSVIRTQPSGSAMVRPPDLLLEGSTVVVPMVQTRTRGGGISGSTTVLVRTTASKRTTEIVERETYAAYLNVTTPNPGPWERHLTERGAVQSCSRTAVGDRVRVSCRLASSVETVAGSVVKVDVTFSS